MADTRRAAIFIDKGGTGKTTNAAELGAALNELGKDVLLLDLAGKQGDLADALGVYKSVQEDITNEDDFPNIATTMGNRWSDVAEMVGNEEAVDRLVYKTDSGVDLIPAHPDLDGLDADLGNIDDVEDRYNRLRLFLDNYVDPLDRWDIIILDMPGLANNITYNGLWAAQNVVTPVSMGSFEFKQAQSLEADLEKIRSGYDQNVELRMIIANLYDRRTNLHKEILEKFEAQFGSVMAPEYTVDSQQIRTVTEEGRTLFDVPDDELLKTGADAKAAFLANAEELYDRLEAAN
ncbi:ParA family protein [Halorubrum lacusprofundi]|jgi:chromosome partitioning protein|uniref:ParA family protein n=1 Tax=Halorubrum lacusprofundi TaxID=2247 RepID=UPI001483A164|nr:ParA family protein [Halorubrum lacusprofundi]MCG1007899.1 ParA family protein [Halorubrum lacusprofundi]